MLTSCHQVVTLRWVRHLPSLRVRVILLFHPSNGSEINLAQLSLTSILDKVDLVLKLGIGSITLLAARWLQLIVENSILGTGWLLANPELFKDINLHPVLHEQAIILRGVILLLLLLLHVIILLRLCRARGWLLRHGLLRLGGDYLVIE